MTPRERPILFSAPMVRALLAGTKTQTRRILTNQPSPMEVEAQYGPSRTFALEVGFCGERSRYGLPGDRLWVKETWRCWERETDRVDGIRFAADDAFVPIENTKEAADLWCAARKEPIGHDMTWRPSIFMRAWMARIRLQVTEVRVQRVQEITEEDARAEGLTPITKDGGRTIKYGIPDRDGLPGTDDDGWPWSDWSTDPREAFKRLWCRINGPESWEANPWVWAISFRRLP